MSSEQLKKGTSPMYLVSLETNNIENAESNDTMLVKEPQFVYPTST